MPGSNIDTFFRTFTPLMIGYLIGYNHCNFKYYQSRQTKNTP